MDADVESRRVVLATLCNRAHSSTFDAAARSPDFVSEEHP